MYEQCDRCNIWSDETEVLTRPDGREPIRLCYYCRADAEHEPTLNEIESGS